MLKCRGQQREILLITWKAGQVLSEVSKWVGQSHRKKIMQLKNMPRAKNYTNDLLCTTYKERPRVMIVVSARTSACVSS